MSHDQCVLQRGDHELKLGSIIDADFTKAETSKMKQKNSVLPTECMARSGCQKLQRQQRKLRNQAYVERVKQQKMRSFMIGTNTEKQEEEGIGLNGIYS